MNSAPKVSLAAVGIVLVAVVAGIIAYASHDPYDAPKPEDAAWAEAARERGKGYWGTRSRDYDRMVEKAETIKTEHVYQYAGVTLVFFSYTENGLPKFGARTAEVNSSGDWELKPLVVFDTGNKKDDEFWSKAISTWIVSGR